MLLPKRFKHVTPALALLSFAFHKSTLRVNVRHDVNVSRQNFTSGVDAEDTGHDDSEIECNALQA